MTLLLDTHELSLAELANLFDREDGRRPVEKSRQDRARAKANRSKK
jgi:hypothetical protein